MKAKEVSVEMLKLEAFEISCSVIAESMKISA